MLTKMEKFDIYKLVTDKLIAQLETGVAPWHKPWGGVADWAVRRENGQPYSLLNQFLLGKQGEWLSFKQIVKEGGTVKTGEKSSFVVFWTQYKYEDELEDGTKVEHVVPVLRYYNVWHIDQTEGIKPKWGLKPVKTPNPIKRAEDVVKHYFDVESVTLENTKPSAEAYYTRTFDRVVVPMMKQYTEAEEYYSTLFHEMTHSTGHPLRLNRREVADGSMFGSTDYSKEELVAELGSTFLCAKCGIDSTKAFKNSAAYIQGWLKALKNDRKMVVYAAGKAEAAAKYILGAKGEHTEHE